MDDDQATYLRFRAFIECTGREAKHCVSADHVSVPTPGTPCFTRAGANLCLCAFCFQFWRECGDRGDQTMWQIGVYLRDPRG